MTPGSIVATFPSLVLIVDDEPSVISLLEKVCKSKGLYSRAASTGEEALSLFDSVAFGCALIDKNLPGIDGLQVMRHARRVQPQCACIMITANASIDTAVEALRLGASDYLEKPFDHVALIGQKIETALKHKQAEHERNLLLEKLRSFQLELNEKDQTVSRQKSEIEMFNELLEKRVKEATEDYRRSLLILESAIKSSRGVDFVLKLHAESLLEYARTIPLDETVPAAQLRGMVTRLVRRLDAHVQLIRQGQQRVAERLASEGKPGEIERPLTPPPED